MKHSIKLKIKKYLLCISSLLLIVSIFANASYFEKPINVFSQKYALKIAKFILPFSESKIEEKQTKNHLKTTENSQKNAEIGSKTAQNEPKTAQKTTKSNEILPIQSQEYGGKVISQTIDKSGANLSLGDVFIRNKTEKSIDISKALKNKPALKIKLNSTKPQVLIVHTHASECFFPKLAQYYPKSWGERDEAPENNMISIGKIIAQKLNKSGIKTIQSQTIFDKESYTYSYDRSREAIISYLKKYPSIKVVLDVHRDAINCENGDKIRPIINVNGKTAGQIMIISGCQSGDITGYPNWTKNLRFNIRLQQKLEQTYPNFARPLFFAEKKYNQDLCENSFLLEVGSQANTLSEAKYSAELFSNVFIKYLKEFS